MLGIGRVPNRRILCEWFNSTRRVPARRRVRDDRHERACFVSRRCILQCDWTQARVNNCIENSEYY